jgi:protein MpaA
LPSSEALQTASSSQEKDGVSTEKPKPPRPKYEELGRSVRGRPIEAIIYGTGKKRVLVVGGIHGNESSTTVVARSLAVTLGRDSVPAGLTVIIVPDANPDALWTNTRVNDRGVDINRNFPSKSWRIDYPDSLHYPGTEPASEPETRALISLLERYPPDLLITLHAALGCMNWDGPGFEIAELMAQVNNYPLCQSLGYETPGSLGNYAGVDRNIPTVTIELRAANAVQLVQENTPALLAALDKLSDKTATETNPEAVPVKETVKPPINNQPPDKAPRR